VTDDPPRDPCASDEARAIEAAILSGLPTDAIDYDPADPYGLRATAPPPLTVHPDDLADVRPDALTLARAMTYTVPPPPPSDVETVDLAGMVAAGATRRQVDHWTRAGLLHPVDRDHAASGVPRRWPLAERDVCTRMAALVSAGVAVPTAHAVARAGGRARVGPVLLAVDPGHDPAGDAYRRDVLRAPARAALALALRALLDLCERTADEVADELPDPPGTFVPPPGTWRVGDVVALAGARRYLATVTQRLTDPAPGTGIPGPDSRTDE
jgi:hypothetical protein